MRRRSDNDSQELRQPSRSLGKSLVFGISVWLIQAILGIGICAVKRRPKTDGGLSVEKMDLLGAVTEFVGLPRKDVVSVLEVFFEELHGRMYEYDDGNGAYVTEELSFELSDKAWIHLYEFLLLDRLTRGCKYPDDEIGMSIETLRYMGGSERWRPYFEKMAKWKMSPRFGLDRPLYGL